MQRFYKLGLRNFSNLKFSANVIGQHTKTDVKLAGNPTTIEIKAPLEGVLGSVGACEVHMIELAAKKTKVDIQKIEVDIKGEYDTGVLYGTKKAPNTFDNIDMVTKIYSNEQDKAKLKETVEMGVKMCPVLNTLRLAGIKINEKIEYI